MKILKNGEVVVRQLMHGGAEVKDVAIPAAALAESGAVTAYFPPGFGPSDVEIAVEALGTEGNATAKSVLTVIGRIKSKGSALPVMISRTSYVPFWLFCSTLTLAQVVVIASQAPADVVVAPHEAVVPLPAGVDPAHAAALTASFIASWVGLVVWGSINLASTVLVHDAVSGM